jgi:hypothetical protein
MLQTAPIQFLPRLKMGRKSNGDPKRLAAFADSISKRIAFPLYHGEEIELSGVIY